MQRLHVEHAKRVFFDRLGNAYVYGAMWSPTNLKQGTDCSGLWNDILCAATTGAVRWGRESEGATTESYRYIDVGKVGPFGTIRVAHWRDIPADAAAKLAFHHEGNGGASSHMWGELDGVRMESASKKGQVTSPQAWPIDHSYANAWAYLPGPIVGGPALPPPPNDTTWGIDISNHQGIVDLDRVKSEDFSFVWAKVSEGPSFRDQFWPGTRDHARRIGLILAGYHYVRTGDPDAQARNFVEHLGDKSIPAMLDFEEGSGGIEQFWAVKNAIEALGVRVALSYIPDWYWERIGKPDLSKVPGLIASEYVSGSGYASVLYPGNSSPFWKSYGGRTPDILQFTSSALVAGKSMDANAFRGTPEQLRALLGTTTTGDDDLIDPTIVKMIREIHACLFNKTESLSDLATPGEGAKWMLHEKIHSIDGMLHPIHAERRARAGDLGELHRIVLAANGQGKDRSPVTVGVYRQILADIERDRPEVLQRYLAARGPAA